MKLELFAICHDGGDGSKSIVLYNCAEEALEEHNREAEENEDPKFNFVSEFKDWMDETPYERGEYSTVTLDVVKGKLIKPVWMSFG